MKKSYQHDDGFLDCGEEFDNAEYDSCFGAEVVSADMTKFDKNAALASGRPYGSGHSYFNAATGVISESIKNAKMNGRGKTPKLSDQALLQYFANLGYIDAHQDRTLLAAMLHYPGAETGFFIGTGLMKHWSNEKQIKVVRSLLNPANQVSFNAAVALYVGRVVSPEVAPVHTVFGNDCCPPSFGADVDVSVKGAQDAYTQAQDTYAQASKVADQVQAGDYTGAALTAADMTGNKDVKKAAQTAAQVADTAEKIGSGDYVGAATNAGKAIGGDVGKVAGAAATGAAVGSLVPVPVVGTAVGAAVGAIAGTISVLIGNAAPDYTEDQYTQMKETCKQRGGEVVYGIPPDQDKACRWPDGTTDGGFNPIWKEENKQAYLADKAARKLQLKNLGDYVAGLKQLDLMFIEADKAMRQPGATIAGRNIWFKKIGDSFARIYHATGQDKFRPLNVAGFVNDPFNQNRVYKPKVALFDSSKKLTGNLTSPSKFAGSALTKGMIAAPSTVRVVLGAPLVAPSAHPDMIAGVKSAIAQTNIAKKSLVRKILEFLHLVKRS